MAGSRVLKGTVSPLPSHTGRGGENRGSTTSISKSLGGEIGADVHIAGSDEERDKDGVEEGLSGELSSSSNSPRPTLEAERGLVKE